MLIRWQLAGPGSRCRSSGELLFPASGGVISPAAYTSLFTMHGTIMIFFAITPILIGGFGNFCIPLMIGARDMAFPRAEHAVVLDDGRASTAIADRVVLRAAGRAPQAGWTAYPPLSTAIGAPGPGQTLWVVALYLERRVDDHGRGQLHHHRHPAARARA